MQTNPMLHVAGGGGAKQSGDEERSVTRLSWAFLFLTVGFTVVGQLLVKWGISKTGVSPARLEQLPRFVLRAFNNFHVLLGLGCAAVAAACWIVVVSRADLSVAYPFMALGIVLVLALTGVVFGETVPLHRWLGVLVVCLGLIVASRG